MVGYHIMVRDKCPCDHLHNWLKSTALKSVLVVNLSHIHGVLPSSVKCLVSTGQKSMLSMNLSFSLPLPLSLLPSLSSQCFLTTQHRTDFHTTWISTVLLLINPNFYYSQRKWQVFAELCAVYDWCYIQYRHNHIEFRPWKHMHAAYIQIQEYKCMVLF